MDKGVVCHLEWRCVKMQRIGSRSNGYTNVSQPLRALPALGYEPAVCLSLKSIDRISYVSVRDHQTSVTVEFSDLCVAHDGIRLTFSRSAH